MSGPDPVAVEIIRQAFSAAAREMHQTLIRGAYSPIIYDMEDCGVGLFDRFGQMLGQSPGLPIFIGGLDQTVRLVHEWFGDPQSGDAFAVNDSFEVGSHLNDVTIVAPAFVDGELVGWSAVKGHWEDVGAKDAGESVDTTEIYQEGIRFKPIRVMAEGEWVRDVVNILCWNSRRPRTLMGDMSAQIAACRMGERRLVDLVERFGLRTVEEARDDIFRQSQEAERAFLRTLPNGEYSAEGFLNGDGQTDDPVPIKLTIRVEDESITFDLTGSSPQRPGNTNGGPAQAISVAHLAVQYLMHTDEEPTGGSFQHVQVVIPKGSVFDAELPAACWQYGSAPGMMLNLTFKAMSEALPSHIIAGQPDSSSNIIITGRFEDGSTFITGGATALGWGARYGADGQNALSDTMSSGLKNHPVETMEAKRPVVVHRYQLRQDSGGPGRWRGGLGVERLYELRHPIGRLSVWFERAKLPGWGLFGGSQGEIPGVQVLYPEGEELLVHKANHIPLREGTLVYARTGGGGGYGPVWERDVEDVRTDIIAGYVSREAAAERYGVHFLPGSLEVDQDKTDTARVHLASQHRGSLSEHLVKAPV